MILIMILSILISMILIILNSLIAMKKNYEREKLSPFECGYDPKSESRMPFSLHFFLVAVIFLIFDVEITIIMPMPLIMMVMDSMLWITLSLFFVMILIIGTIHEWSEGSLEWSS